jgi:hypothetical protein
MFKLPDGASLRSQISWLGVAAAIPSGLAMFSKIKGDAGSQIGDLLYRVVLNYNNIISYIFRSISKVFSLDLFEYRNEFSFFIIILIPYIIRHRKVKFGGFLESNQRLLAVLNLTSISLISVAFPHNHAEPWAISVFLLVGLIFLIGYLTYFFVNYADFENSKKRNFITGMIAFAYVLFSVVYISKNITNVFELNEWIVPFCAVLLSKFSYLFASLFRKDGNYPFLFASIFYIVLFCLDFFSRDIFPKVDSFLRSIGA